MTPEADLSPPGVPRLQIRPAVADDLQTLIDLYADLDGSPPLDWPQAERLWQQIQQVPNYRIYLAELQSDTPPASPIGTFSLVELPTFMHRGWHQSAVLDAVIIHSAYRGHGWGTAMLQAALDICQQRGCYKVTLSSNLKRDRTHAFYRRLGFDQHGWSFLLQIQPGSAPTDP